MKIFAITAFSAALVAANSISIVAAYETHAGNNLVTEIVDEYSEGYDELSFIFEEKMLKSCESAIAKLQRCANKAAADHKWQKSIMTAGAHARACILQKGKKPVKKQQQECKKPFIKLLETKCPKETKKLLGNVCKVFHEDEVDMDKFEFPITHVEGGLDEDYNFDENRVEYGVLNFEEMFQCRTEQLQLKRCFNQHSNEDPIFHSTAVSAASVETICFRAATKKREKRACTRQLQAILESKCPTQTRRVLKVCTVKNGELRATSLN